MQITHGPDAWQPMGLAAPIAVATSGYIVVFRSTSSAGVSTYIDHLSMTLYKGATQDMKHYYPFGLATTLAMNTATSTATPTTAYPFENRYQYQTKDYDKRENLYLNDFHARQYDPQLGRMMSLDAANQFASGYTGMGNNPVMVIDPTGNYGADWGGGVEGDAGIGGQGLNNTTPYDGGCGFCLGGGSGTGTGDGSNLLTNTSHSESATLNNGDASSTGWDQGSSDDDGGITVSVYSGFTPDGASNGSNSTGNSGASGGGGFLDLRQSPLNGTSNIGAKRSKVGIFDVLYGVQMFDGTNSPGPSVGVMLGYNNIHNLYAEFEWVQTLYTTHDPGEEPQFMPDGHFEDESYYSHASALEAIRRAVGAGHGEYSTIFDDNPGTNGTYWDFRAETTLLGRKRNQNSYQILQTVGWGFTVKGARVSTITPLHIVRKPTQKHLDFIKHPKKYLPK